MRLSHIEIENFKGISSRQRIELRPITLLFGPNSAGKSTIMQALHYFREVLERNNPDPDQTLAGGLTDLGGFATLIHNHDLSKTIRVKVRIDISKSTEHERLPLNTGESLRGAEFLNLAICYIAGENLEYQPSALVREVGLEIAVRWSELLQAPYLSEVIIELNGQVFAEIQSPPQGGRAQLQNFNFSHPLVEEIIDSTAVLLGEDTEVFSSDANDISDVDLEGDPISSPLGSEIWELSREMVVDASAKDTGAFRVGVATNIGALPDLNKPLQLDLVDIDLTTIQQKYYSKAGLQLLSTEDEARAEEEYGEIRLRLDGLNLLLDDLVLGPTRIVRDFLKAMTYIGPLREIPGRNYRAQLSPDEARWAGGLAAWDLLHADQSGELINNVNTWLESEKHFQSGYRIERSEYKVIPVPSAFHQLFERGLEDDDLGDLQERYSTLSSQTELTLRDTESGTVVTPSDVGVGISQMIPVVVGSLRSTGGIVAVEQPELHIHPAIQVGMGDLFISGIQPDDSRFGSQKTFLIETHSEHIMLRLLRRIRETSEEDGLPPGVDGLTPDELSVVYVEGSSNGAQFRSLRVSGDGDFLDKWPKGFFEERAEELF
jgi:hypothetical protein